MISRIDRQAASGDTPDLPPPRRIHVVGKILRTLFIATLIVVTARVASPQNEHLSSIYETPSDLVRLVLGLSVCLWLTIHLFVAPKDDDAFRTWFYLGLAVLPLAVITTIVIW
jgi:hypothetical protein